MKTKRLLSVLLSIAVFALSISACSGKAGPQGPQGEQGTPGLNGSQGLPGKDGSNGRDGSNGTDGVSIVSVVKTGSDGLTDTYTITYSNGTTSTFTVTNGAKGEQGSQGPQGNPGADGHTPIITIGENGHWYIDGVDTDVVAQGPQGTIGPQGPQGEQGISIISSLVNEDGDLVITLSNGQVINAGHIKDIDTYAVNFYIGEDLIDTQIVNKGDRVSRPGSNLLEGYIVNDWYYLDGSTQESWKFFAYGVYEDINLYADFSYRQYTITFVDNTFNCNIAPLQVTFKHNYVLPQPTETGYTLSWVDSNDEVWTNGNYTLTSDITLYARWTIKQIAITLNPNGGTVSQDTIYITYNESYSLETPASDSYLFDGWYCNDSSIANSGDNWTYTDEDIVLTAHWRSPFVIEDNILISCDTSIKHAIIPEGVIEIKDSAFANSHLALRQVTFPSTLKTIGSYAFNYCRNLQAIDLPTGLTTIKNDAFYGCTSLTSLVIPNTVTYLGSQAFRLCTHLESVIVPGSISTINHSAFYGCDVLSDVTLGNGIIHICEDAFFSDNLSTIVIPNTVTTIDGYAFGSNCNMTAAYVPSSVITMGGNVFYACYEATIYCQATSKPTGWDDKWNSSNRPVEWGVSSSV